MVLLTSYRSCLVPWLGLIVVHGLFAIFHFTVLGYTLYNITTCSVFGFWSACGHLVKSRVEVGKPHKILLGGDLCLIGIKVRGQLRSEYNRFTISHYRWIVNRSELFQCACSIMSMVGKYKLIATQADSSRTTSCITSCTTFDFDPWLPSALEILGYW